MSTPHTMALTAGLLFAIAGVLGLVTVALYQPPRGAVLASFAVACVGAGAILVLVPRVPFALLQAMPVIGGAMITAVVLLAGPGPLSNAYTILYVFVVTDAALFFRWRFAAAHWALAAVTHVGTTLVTGQPLVEVGVQQVAYAAVGAMTAWLVRTASTSTIDPVTGLADRRGFDQWIERALDQADQPIAIALLDLDGFGALNRQHGPEHGDQVLTGTGGVLTELVAGRGQTYRFGSDEFVVLVQAGTLDSITTLIDRARTALAPVTFAAAVTRTGPKDTRASLTRRLVNALPGAAGRTVVVEESNLAAARLRAALAAGDLCVHYQPIVTLGQRGVVGAEALVRWQSAAGLVPPAQFVPQAEQDGTIVELGRWVMATACADAAGWPGRVRVSVNVSHVELCRPDYAAEVLATCARTGLAPAALVIELTETTLGLEDEHVVANLTALRATGVGVSIDDFGTGYSSLARLHELPVSELKIDRAFVSALDAEHEPSPVLEAIVALARALDLDLVAEGVETAEQERALAGLGVTRAQGFRFARPAPAAELVLAGQVPAQVRRR